MINFMIFQFIVLDIFFMQTQNTGDRFNVFSVDVNPITYRYSPLCVYIKIYPKY